VTPATAADATTTDAFDQLRGVWSDILTGGSAVNPTDPDYATAIATIDAIAAAAIALYDDSANPTAVYTDLPFTHVENASGTYYRIRDTAIAWATPGSAHYQDAAVAARLVAALKLIGAAYYNPSSTPAPCSAARSPPPTWPPTSAPWRTSCPTPPTSSPAPCSPPGPTAPTSARSPSCAASSPRTAT
jgi:hypothetical protein